MSTDNWSGQHEFWTMKLPKSKIEKLQKLKYGWASEAISILNADLIAAANKNKSNVDRSDEPKSEDSE
jgi:hypothetical protein